MNILPVAVRRPAGVTPLFFRFGPGCNARDEQRRATAGRAGYAAQAGMDALLLRTIDVVNNNMIYSPRGAERLSGLIGTMADRRLAARNGANAASMPRRNGAKPLDLGVLENHLGYFVRRAQIFVFQDFIRTLAEIDVSPAQYSVLVVIGANRGPSQAEVAELLGIERARLVRMLDHLEKRGLTQRLPAANDRRSHALHLTPGGQKLLKRAKALAAMHEVRLQARLGAGHHKLLLDALRGFEL
jgi:DNA-binding MarR family transcriptional regulator